MTLRDSIIMLIKAGEVSNIIEAKVKSVSGYTCDVSPIDGTADITGVYLQTEEANGILIIPEINSVVYVSMLSKDVGYVTMYGGATSIKIRGEQFGGLVKVGEVTDKLNAIENKINDLINVFTTWAPVANDGGAALKTALSDWISSQLTETEVSDIENENVTHG